MYNLGSFIQSCSLRKQDISYFPPSSRLFYEGYHLTFRSTNNLVSK